MRVLILSVLLLGCHRDLDDGEVADSGAVAETSTETSSVEDSGEKDVIVDACECTPGETVAVTGACPGALEKKSKTCDASCKWKAEECALPKGWTAIPDAPIEGRLFPSLVWTGGEAIVFGGSTALEGTRTNFADGALYSLRKNAWEKLAVPAIVGRSGHSAVWAASEIIVFGGETGTAVLGDGASWDGFKKTWTTIPTSPLAPRSGHAAAWTGTEMIVWGGGDSSKVFADGARYSGSNWTLLPAAPIAARSSHVLFWTGSRIVIWGGRDAAGTLLDDGALFDPTSNTWSTVPASGKGGRRLPAAAVTSTHLFVFGGIADPAPMDGMILSLTGAPAWSSIPAPPEAIFAAAGGVGWAQGDALSVWSGATKDGFTNKGAVFNRATSTWSAMDVAKAPDARLYSVATWAGSCAFVWGGVGNPGGGAPERLATGAIYVP